MKGAEWTLLKIQQTGEELQRQLEEKSHITHGEQR